MIRSVVIVLRARRLLRPGARFRRSERGFDGDFAIGFVNVASFRVSGTLHFFVRAGLRLGWNVL